VIDDDDNVVPKIVECNNCGAVHKVNEIGKSEIVIGKDGVKSSVTVDDIKFSLPQNLADVLKNYNCALPVWEEVLFCVENEKWGSDVILTKEEIDGAIQGKLLKILSPSQLKIESFVHEMYID
jgi:hypothetical protein